MSAASEYGCGKPVNFGPLMRGMWICGNTERLCPSCLEAVSVDDIADKCKELRRLALGLIEAGSGEWADVANDACATLQRVMRDLESPREVRE